MNMKKMKLTLAGICLAVFLIVILQNSDAVETRFLFVSVVMPQTVLLAVTLLIGFTLGALTMTWLGRKKR